MITKITTVEELKQIFTEILLNKTDAVTKITDGSAVNGIAFGNAKTAQKVMKDVAVLESLLFADAAYGSGLDNVARLSGTPQRFGAGQSSTYERVEATPGTVYTPLVQTFKSTTGVVFDVCETYTVGPFGYGYVKIRSQITGSATNVDALTINTIVNPPVGHNYCVNEYAATYGTDVEIDPPMRKRCMDGPDILSRGTISMLEQVFMKINSNILKLYYSGLDTNSRIVLSVLTQNGIDLNPSEINDILSRGQKFFSLTEMRPLSFNGYPISLQPAKFQPIDISMRVDLDANYNPDKVRIDMQTRMNKYLDYRYWRVGQSVNWTNLLEIAQFTDGINYVSDSYFYPNNDVSIDVYHLPRIRGFQMLDLNGNLIKDLQGILNPVFYPNDIDFIYQATVLASI